MRNLNLGQRVVLVVSLGAVCVTIDGFVAPRSPGWFGYAPNTDAVFVPRRGKTKALVVRIVLAVAWASVSTFLLRTPKPER